MNLRQASEAAKGEIWQLEVIELDSVEVKEKSFPKVEKDESGKETTRTIAYKVMVVNGKEYNIREKQLNQIKELLENKPLTKKIRFMKFDDGKVNCIPLG